MTLGQLLRQTRKDLRLTQIQMAKRMRITQGNLSKIENDLTPMRVDALINLWDGWTPSRIIPFVRELTKVRLKR